jgi:hypothetical protein
VHGDLEVAAPLPDEPSDLTRIEPAVLTGIIERSSFRAVESVSAGRLLHRAVVIVRSSDDAQVFDATDGHLLSPLTEVEAAAVAEADFVPGDEIVGIELVTERRGEYRGPVPAYRVSFGNSKRTNVYVRQSTGEVTARRNRIWRGFDFMWMLHILDFADRTDFNNWLLRIMSLLGLVTLLSGYGLWVLASPLFRRRG